MPYQLKLERFEQHVSVLDGETTKWVKANVRILRPVRDRATGEQVVRVRLKSEPPDRWGPIIGDCFFNLRSALDHLALDLAIAYARGPVSARVEEKSQFPIFGKRAPTGTQWAERIGGVDPKAADLIEALQPYHRGSAFVYHPLWEVHHLNNVDKHRALHPAVVAVQQAGFTPRNANVVPLTENWGILGDRAELVRYRATPIVAGQPMRVSFDAGLYVSFTFGGGGLQDPVVAKLRALARWTRDNVFTPLQAFL